MHSSTMAAGSWMVLLILAIEIISDGLASQFRIFDTQHDAKIKCVYDYELLVREGISLVTCLFLCYAKQGCVGAKFDQTSGVCYACGLFSEVAPETEMDSNTMIYIFSDEQNTTVAARLNSATGSLDSGRIQIRYNGSWGMICDDRWVKQLRGYEENNINVMCYMLGFPSGGRPMISWLHQMPEDVSFPIWMDDVECTGTEVTIVDCRFRGFGSHDCYDNEYVGLQCNP